MRKAYLTISIFFISGILGIFAETAIADESLPFEIIVPSEKYGKELQAAFSGELKENRERYRASGITLATVKRIRSDIELLDKLLRAEGFYNGKVQHEVKDNKIFYYVDIGQPYRIESLTINSSQQDINLPVMQSLDIEQGHRLRAQRVLSAKDGLKHYIEEHNCLWQIDTNYDVTINHDTAEADVVFNVVPAAQVIFGEINFEGLTSVKQKFSHNTLDIHEGDCFRKTDLEKGRLRLLQTGLFSLVDTEILQPDNGKVPVIIEVKERNHRTIKAGAGYNLDEGPGINAGWEHRNIFGSGQKLNIAGRYSKLFKSLDTTLTVPAFRGPKQSLELGAEVSSENLDTFDAYGLTVQSILRRKFTQRLQGSAGVQYKLKSIDEDNDKQTFGLVSVPLGVEYDRRDNVLDPKKGWVAAAQLQPYVGTLHSDIHFLKLSLGASTYFTFEEAPLSPTLALRGALGSIYGLDTLDIPADERFYAGGSGSVRGYPLHEIGPFDDDGDPTGGKSLMELSVEGRFRVNADWGGVVFIDGGNVYNRTLPQLDETPRWAAGFGVRYFTALAPVRFDIAFPINPTDEINDSFQIYVSLAQAF